MSRAGGDLKEAIRSVLTQQTPPELQLAAVLGSWAGSPSSRGSPADKEYECGARGDKDAKLEGNGAVAEVLEAEGVLSVMIQQETSA